MLPSHKHREHREHCETVTDLKSLNSFEFIMDTKNDGNNKKT